MAIYRLSPQYILGLTQNRQNLIQSASAKKIISSITGRAPAIEITQSVATTGKERKKLAVKGELVSGNINITQRG